MCTSIQVRTYQLSIVYFNFCVYISIYIFLGVFYLFFFWVLFLVFLGVFYLFFFWVLYLVFLGFGVWVWVEIQTQTQPPSFFWVKTSVHLYLFLHLNKAQIHIPAHNPSSFNENSTKQNHSQLIPSDEKCLKCRDINAFVCEHDKPVRDSLKIVSIPDTNRTRVKYEERALPIIQHRWREDFVYAMVQRHHRLPISKLSTHNESENESESPIAQRCMFARCFCLRSIFKITFFYVYLKSLTVYTGY